jgi:SAM-dependent methyltransferase
MIDSSNGYEEHAETFIRSRNPRIGTDVVRAWAQEFTPGAAVLELGCGHGVISRVFLERGLKLYVVDASPTLLRAFSDRFAHVATECCRAEDSTFFGRNFDAVAAWGLLFLLDENAQRTLLTKVAQALLPGGRFLFTAPREAATWRDATTVSPSLSLGAGAYEEILRREGLEVAHGTTDEGGNYYYFASKRP